MANKKSAEKRMRQDVVRKARNRSRKSRLRNSVKALRAAVQAGDASAAQQLLPGTLSLIDRTCQKGTIHGNAAARRKSRLVRLVRALES